MAPIAPISPISPVTTSVFRRDDSSSSGESSRPVVAAFIIVLVFTVVYGVFTTIQWIVESKQYHTGPSTSRQSTTVGNTTTWTSNTAYINNNAVPKPTNFPPSIEMVTFNRNVGSSSNALHRSPSGTSEAPPPYPESMVSDTID